MCFYIWIEPNSKEFVERSKGVEFYSKPDITQLYLKKFHYTDSFI